MSLRGLLRNEKIWGRGTAANDTEEELETGSNSEVPARLSNTNNTSNGAHSTAKPNEKHDFSKGPKVLEGDIDGVVKVAQNLVVLKPIVVATVSGGDGYIGRNVMRVGSNNQNDNAYGTGKTANSKASDVGNTWRLVTMFRNRGLWIQAPHLFKGENALDKVDLILELPVKKLHNIPKNSKLFSGKPMFLNSGGMARTPDVAFSDNGRSLGVLRGDRYYFYYPNADLDKKTWRNFGIHFRAGSNTAAGSYIEFNSDVLLTVAKSGALEKHFAAIVSDAGADSGASSEKKGRNTHVVEGPDIDSDEPYRGGDIDSPLPLSGGSLAKPNGLYVGPKTVEISSKYRGATLSPKNFLDGEYKGEAQFTLRTLSESTPSVIVDLQEPRYMERAVLTNADNAVFSARNIRVSVSDNKKDWKEVFFAGGFQSVKFMFYIKRKFRYLRITNGDSANKKVLALRNIALFVSSDEIRPNGLYCGESSLELSSAFSGRAVNNERLFLQGDYSGGSACNLHTNSERNAWFIIDLKASRDVERFLLRKRVGFTERGSNLKVYASEDKQSWKAVAKMKPEMAKKAMESVEVNTKARYFKFEQDQGKSDSINLRNIGVFLNKTK